MGEYIVEAKNLCKYFKAGKNQTLKAVDGVNIRLEKGETLGLVGESGCGKTTCGRTLVKLYDATSGTVLFEGKDVSKLKGKELLGFRKDAQIIFQDPYASLDPRMTIGEIITEGMNVHFHLSEKEKEERVNDLLHKVGLNTFYGQSFLADVCELGPEMLPYSRRYFEELISTGGIREIVPSEIWYGERESFTPDQAGKELTSHPDHGFELLQGPSVFSGKILGGCIDSMYDFFNGELYADMPLLCEKYRLFPALEDWRDRILLLESSEEKMPPEKYRMALEYLKKKGVFDVVSGVLVGKPMDETYAEEYKRHLIDVIGNPQLPVICNINIGHATPRCIIPFGVEAVVDAENQIIRFTN